MNKEQDIKYMNIAIEEAKKADIVRILILWWEQF